MRPGGSAGTCGEKYRAEPSVVDRNRRRLAWFTDAELAAELDRRGAAALAEPAPTAPRRQESQ